MHTISEDRRGRFFNISRGENQKSISDIFGEMEIYTSNESCKKLCLGGGGGIVMLKYTSSGGEHMLL